MVKPFVIHEESLHSTYFVCICRGKWLNSPIFPVYCALNISDEYKVVIVDLMSFVVSEWPLVGVLAAMVAAFLVLESKKGGTVVSHHQATRLVNSGEAVIVDIRDSKDYKAGHIVDAINIPFSSLAEKSDELSQYKDKQIIMVDKMGQQTGSGGKILRDKGFNVVRLNGGVAEWTHQNLPLIQD